jgi:hypothetical protein
MLVAAVILSPPSHSQIAKTDIQAVGTEFRMTLPDGRTLTSAQMVGAVLSISGPDNGRQTVRIEAVEPDPSDPDHDIQLHTLLVQDPNTGSWSNLCLPGPDGIAKAFPLSGVWTKDGRHLPDEHAFALICTGGAIGKCVRWGYKPWRSAANGESLWDYHQACVRMVRADYGGDGIGHTRDDTPIDVYDRLGILQPTPDPGRLAFEAAWGVGGAVCVRKPRIPGSISLDELERRYPRLIGQTGERCPEDLRENATLLYNRS